MNRKKKEQLDYDSTTTCVACGGIIYIKDKIRRKHVCSKTYDAAMKAANARAYDEVPTRRAMTFEQRLALGFELLDEDGKRAPDDR
jgi:hypothetical protein